MADDTEYPEERPQIPAAGTMTRRSIESLPIYGGSRHLSYPVSFLYTEDIVDCLVKIHRLHQGIITFPVDDFFRSRLALRAVEEEFLDTCILGGQPAFLGNDVYAVEGTGEASKQFKKPGALYHRLLAGDVTLPRNAEDLLSLHAQFSFPITGVTTDSKPSRFRDEPKDIYSPEPEDESNSSSYYWRIRVRDTDGTYMFTCPVFPQLRQHLRALHDFIMSPGPISFLIRTGVFHFYFGYLHPFPSRNGFVLRYLTTVLLTLYFHDLSFLPFSEMLWKYSKDYFPLFREAEQAHSEGNLTPFLFSFLYMLAEAMNKFSFREELALDQQKKLTPFLDSTLPGMDDNTKKVVHMLLTHSLICKDGITMKDLLTHSGLSRTTIQSRLDTLPCPYFQFTRKKHPVRYRLDVEALLRDAGVK